QLVRHPDALRRFHKEARLLAEVNSPYVANLLEVNEDDGVHYLVLEFVAGRDLGDLLAERRRLDERTALAVVADVCRGLAETPAPTFTPSAPPSSTSSPAGRRSSPTAPSPSSPCTPSSRLRHYAPSTPRSATRSAAWSRSASPSRPTPATPTPPPCCSTWNAT